MTIITEMVEALEAIAALRDRAVSTCSMDAIEADRIARTTLAKVRSK